jgi:hypothetical protein
MMVKIYNLFIDDQIDEINQETGKPIRDPAVIDPSRSYVSVKTNEAAIEYMLEHGSPQFIHFDHDLGEDENGNAMETHQLAQWMIEYDLDHPGFIPGNFEYAIHSKNINASNNLSRLSNYLRHRKDGNVGSVSPFGKKDTK